MEKGWRGCLGNRMSLRAKQPTYVYEQNLDIKTKKLLQDIALQ